VETAAGLRASGAPGTRRRAKRKPIATTRLSQSAPARVTVRPRSGRTSRPRLSASATRRLGGLCARDRWTVHRL